MKKKRKPRGINKHGDRNFDLCPVCLWPHCDPDTMSPRIHLKLEMRKRAGLCPACGHESCACKSSLEDE